MRTSADQVDNAGVVRNGFDYDLQVWVKDYIIVLAGSQEQTMRLCGIDIRGLRKNEKTGNA